MAASRIYLKGGPCDGKTVSADEIVGGLVAYIKCGGGYYIVDDGATHAGADGVFKYAGKRQPGPPAGSDRIPPHLHHGWNQLRRSFNVHMVRDLDEATRITRKSLRSLSRARRVRI